MIAQQFTDGARPATDQVARLVHDAFRHAAQELAKAERGLARPAGEGTADIPAVRLLRHMDGAADRNSGERIKVKFSAPEGEYPGGYPVAADLETTIALIEDLVNGNVVYQGRADSMTAASSESLDKGEHVGKDRLIRLLKNGAEAYSKSTNPPIEDGFKIFWGTLVDELSKVPLDAEFVLERNSRVLEHTKMSVGEAVEAVADGRARTLGQIL